jgi:hypothetical protein
VWRGRGGRESAHSTIHPKPHYHSPAPSFTDQRDRPRGEVAHCLAHLGIERATQVLEAPATRILPESVCGDAALEERVAVDSEGEKFVDDEGVRGPFSVPVGPPDQAFCFLRKVKPC